MQAWSDFGKRMTRGLKLQASLEILEEQRGERTSIPCIVALTGRNTPVVSLQAVVDNSKNDESEYLRRDFLGASYLMDFSEEYEDNKNDVHYQACLQELEELIVQAMPQPQSEAQTETQSGKASKEKEVLSERPESVEQDDFPMDNDDQVHDDNDDVDDVDDDDDNVDFSLVPIPGIPLTASWESYWSEMEAASGWTLRTGGIPFLYIKPGRNTRPGESELGVDYFNTKADVQAFAREQYGWRGDDNDHVNQDTECIVSPAQTTPNQKTQSMVVTPSPSRVEVQCPICLKVTTTYSCEDRIPLPLTADGIADWYQCWPKGTDNPRRAASAHFKKEHHDIEDTKFIKWPCSIRPKNKKRDIVKLPNGKADKTTYARLLRGERKLQVDTPS
jgi:hypothetical protein